MSAVITVEGVTKTFRPDAPRTLNESIRRLVRGDFGGRRERTVALDDVNLSVDSGQGVAVVGPNGAGKTTLLRLVAGVSTPDRGTILVNGRVGTLLELGVGFHPDLTGRRSAHLGAVIAGLSQAQARSRLSDIVEFAGLADVIDDPVRTYSAGMQARLAFAVAVHVDADILLVDEVLAVGDLAFRERCLARMRSLRNDGATLLFSSHDFDLATQMCDEAVWLDEGRVRAAGTTNDVVASYREAVDARMRAMTPGGIPSVPTADGAVLVGGENRWGTQQCTLHDVRILLPRQDGEGAIDAGEPIAVELSVTNSNGSGAAEAVNVQAKVVRVDEVTCISTNTSIELAPGSTTRLRVDMDRIDLVGGRYFIDLGLYHRDWTTVYDYHQAVYPVRVRGPGGGDGIVATSTTWTASSREP